ncbi:MAG: trypsin-like peptidase domain-containing protein [Candidatus Gastranaerophilales bacterium]|nr:trypsin-like peptidase domain-containing protein [Candidatus Gastranaerophilales bacterium]
MAKTHKCNYTGYADDITFSTTLNVFPKELAIIDHLSNDYKIEIGNLLKNILLENGFELNEKKVRLQTKQQRQEVTGLIVNKKRNVKRSLIKQIRAMLHAWGKYGLQNAEKEYFLKYDKKQRNPDFEPPMFNNVVVGKIHFIKMIRGDRDPIYRKLLNKYNTLIMRDGITKKRYNLLPIDSIEEIQEKIWIIESEDEYGTKIIQGTAFSLVGYGLITCDHCIIDENETVIYKWYEVNKRHKIKVLKRNKDIDIAIFTLLEESIYEIPSFTQKDNPSYSHGTKLTIADFTQYGGNDTPNIRDARISGHKETSVTICMGDNLEDITVKRCKLDTPIIAGDSCGPILDKNNEVVGVAVTGADCWENTKETENYGVIPIQTINYLINNGLKTQNN